MPCLMNIGRRNKMKIDVVSVQKSEPKSEFPLICRNKNLSSLIVIFHSETSGMVLASYKNYHLQPGDYSNNWMDCHGGNWEMVKEKLVFEFEND